MDRLILLLGLGFAFLQAAPQVIVDTAEWRRTRENDLASERGWLSVSGLPWLKEGENSLGSGEGNAVRVADGPKVWGVVARTGTFVELRPAEGPRRLITPADPPFQVGRTWVQLIQRGERIGLRLWDPLNARKLAFPGLKWYEIRPAYKVQGRLIPVPSPAGVRIANVIGQVIEYPSPGVVEFELLGRRYELTPVFETPERTELFYIFKDGTAGKTTYGAGRFLYSALPDAEGRVVLDFNRAYSPPCAFTDFATCPLPPAQNRIDVAIEAGERDPHHPLIGGPQGAQPPMPQGQAAPSGEGFALPLPGGFALAQGRAAPSGEGFALPPRPPSGRLRASGRSDKRAKRLCPREASPWRARSLASGHGVDPPRGSTQEFGLR